MATGSFAGVKVTGDYDREVAPITTQVNRFDARTGYPGSGYGNSDALTDRFSFLDVPISDTIVEFNVFSTGETNLTVDFSTSGLVTLKRTELSAKTPKTHDPVQMTFYSPTFTGLAGIVPVTTLRVAEVPFLPGSVTATLDTLTGFLNITLGPYQRRQQGDTEVAVFQLLLNPCTLGACCNIATSTVKGPNTVCSASALQTCAEALGTCDGVSADCQLKPKCAGTECKAGSFCKKPALCDGTSLLCGANPNKPNGINCPWRPLSYRDGLFASTSDSKTVSVSVKEAAAWLTGSPQYDVEWPSCHGACHEGACALKYAHPACCHVPQYGPYDTGAADYAKQSAEEVKADLQGYWRGRDFYCWR